MADKKSILIFIDWYWPGYKAGGPIQSIVNLTAHLSEDFNFRIFTRNTDYTETIPYSNINSDEWNKISDNVEVYYASENKIKSSLISQIIRDSNCETIFINGIYSFKFSLLPLLSAKKFKDKKVIVSVRGMLAESAINIKRFKKRAFISLAKTFGLYNNVYFHATNQKEAYDIIREIDPENILIAPNLPRKISTINTVAKIQKFRGSAKFFVVARIAPEKNLLYALNILKECEGEILFDIYGPAYDEKYWQRCKKVIAELPPNIKVNYKESLPSDKLMETISGYHALLMPTRGENFGHIIIESFLAGLPVIISKNTPWKGLKEKSIGFDLDISNEQEFVKAVNYIVNLDNTEFDRMSQSASAFADKYFNNEENLIDNKKMLG